jgi:hypothetical protein
MSQPAEQHRVERGLIGLDGEVTWVPEDRLARIACAERQLIERELARCISALDAEFDGRAPLSTRLLLKEAIEWEINRCTKHGS